MTIRSYIIAFLVIVVVAVTIIFVSTRNDSKLKIQNSKLQEYSALVQSALETGNYAQLLDLGIIDKIPTTEKEIAALNSKLKKIIRDRSNYAKKDGQNVDQTARLKDDDQKKTENNDSTNLLTNILNDGEESNDEKTLNKDAEEVINSNSTKKTSNLSDNNSEELELQQDMLGLSVQSNDLVIAFDKNTTGITTNGNQIIVGADKLNSDLLNNSYSNSAGIWIMNLDSETMGVLSAEYGERLFWIPGVGHYILRENIAPDSDDFYKEKNAILNEALKLNPDSSALHLALIKSYVDDFDDMDLALNAIKNWNGDKSYYEARIYKLGSLNSDGEERDILLNKAIECYQDSAYYDENPNSKCRTLLGISAAYDSLGDESKALEFLENNYYDISSTADEKWCDKTSSRIANYYKESADYETSIEWYDKLSKPGMWDYVGKAHAYNKLGNYSKAAQIYEDGGKRYSKNPKLSISSSLLYLEAGNKYKANELYKIANKRLKKISKNRRIKIKNSRDYINLKNKIGK